MEGRISAIGPVPSCRRSTGEIVEVDYYLDLDNGEVIGADDWQLEPLIGPDTYKKITWDECPEWKPEHLREIEETV
jgi:hypothetical protein